MVMEAQGPHFLVSTVSQTWQALSADSRIARAQSTPATTRFSVQHHTEALHVATLQPHSAMNGC